MRNLLLLLAVVGAAVPMFYFVRWMNEFGYDLPAMVEAWTVNDAATGLALDLTISAAALTIWALWETMRSRRWSNLLAIPATLCIGVSCGLPLYLWLRSR